MTTYRPQVKIDMEETYAILCHSSSLERQLSTMRQNAAFCIVAGDVAYNDTLVEALQCLSKKGKAGIYVSATRSYDATCKYLDARGVDISQLIIIDAMTMELMYGDCAYEKGSAGMLPESMGKISRAVLRGAASNSGGFVLFDSVEVFARYEDARSARVFFSQTLDILKKTNVTAVAISTPSASTDGLDSIYELFDVKIKVG